MRHERRQLVGDHRHGDDENVDDDDADDDVIRWPAFKHRSGKYLVLDVPMREGTHLREEQCDFWEPFFLGSIHGSVPASSPANDLCGKGNGADSCP